MSCSYGGIDGRSRSGIRQRLIPENIVELGTFKVRQVSKLWICWGRLQQGDAARLGLVVFKLIEVVEVTGIMTTTEDDVATGWVITEGTQHFYQAVSSYTYCGPFATCL